MQRAASGTRRCASLVTTLVTVALAVGCSSDPSPPAAAAPAPMCAADTQFITLPDGTNVYQEPGALLDMGGELLLVGAPTYGFLPQPPDGDALPRFRTPYAATYLGDPPRMVPKPIDGFLYYAIAASLGGGRWASILAEGQDSLGQEVRALWYAEHDGSRWTLVEPLPLPDGAFPEILMSSALVDAGDRLVWVAMDYYAAGDPIFVYERRDGEWSIERHEYERLETAVIAHDEQWGLWMLLVGVQDDGARGVKTMRLFRRRDDWELVHRLEAYGAHVLVRWPRVSIAPSGLTVSWVLEDAAGARALTRTGITSSSSGVPHVLDEGVENVYSTVMPDGSVAWLVDHVGPNPSPDPVARRHDLGLIRIVEGRASVVASMPSPFVGRFRIHPVSGDEVLVVGAQMGLVRPQVPVRSLLLRLSSSC